MSTKSYIGKGTVYLQIGSNPLVSIGNVSKLGFNISEEKIEQQDYENAGGGVTASVSRIKSVGVDLTGYSFDDTNMALATRGTAAARAGAAIVDEAVKVVKGGLVTLARLQDLDATITVEDAGTPLVEGTDFIRRRSGIEFTATTAIANGTTVDVSYTALADSLIQGLVESAQNVRLVFDGLNEADSGKPVVIEAFKVQFSPTKGLDLIGDAFGTIQLSGTVLKDETKTANGVSQYFTVKKAA